MKSPYYSDGLQDWSTIKQEKENQLIHSLYLIGDGGELDDTIQDRNFVLDAAAKLLKLETTETSLVFLGDNVYPKGLPKKDDPDRNIAERILNAQLELSESHSGKTYFIPGNHDWNKYKKGGRKAILRQEKYIKNFDEKNKRVRFFPEHACGDPKVVKINKDLVYVFLDSQWWLQDWDGEKKMNNKCDIQSRGDLLKRIEEIFVDHKNDEIIVMLHHPIKSNGKHGGKFSFKHHVFPLTELKSNLWIPLPIIGSAYPIFRNVTGSVQDIPNVKNQDLMQGIDRIAKERAVNVIFVSGHDHGMQYFDGNKRKYIVSGGGSRRDYIRGGGELSYGRAERGFAKINFYENNESWLEMYTVIGFGEEPVLEFRKQLRKTRPGTTEDEKTYPEITQKQKTRAANANFAAGPIKKLFLGSHHRDLWATPVQAEVIDLESKFGGLVPIKKGGGNSSNSLRMEKENGQQYILRSIIKDFSKLVPSDFSNLLLMDALADQNSASHPYGALIIPKLSKAAGVYYSQAQLVYLQHQQGLGNYNSQFPEELYLLEERPSGDWSDAPHFGNSKEIISYSDILDILRAKKNHFIDQEWVLKSRLFDLFIHDWDRHDDQWRWAKFEEDGRNIYRPIPRDRDQAFYKVDGIVPRFISSAIKQLQSMRSDDRGVKYLAFNAKHFDRYFLHELEWSEWEMVIKKFQEDISDKDIEEAIQDFPPEILHMSSVKELDGFLKEKRKNLVKIGKKLYDFLSEEVEVIGTDNKDRFEIDQEANGNMVVKHYVERKNKGDLLKYERRFYPHETKEVRLYGLRGKDEFIISGASNNSIALTIVGGEDDDKVDNTNSGREVFVYDDLDGIESSGDVVDRRSNSLDVNEYDRYGFKYNTNTRMLSFGNTPDDGFWIGASLGWINHGWRKNPYKSKHGFSFSLAPGSRNAYQINYNAHVPNAIGRVDFAPQIDFQFPHYKNYFGIGGNTINAFREIEYNWVRMKNIDIEPMLRYRMGNSIHLDFGPIYQYRQIEKSIGRITNEEPTFFKEAAFESRNYIGVSTAYKIGFADNKVFPTNGFSFLASASQLLEPGRKENLTELGVEAQMYVQLLIRPKLVIANSIGYMSSFGDRQFYHYPSLGNEKGLRGFRNERFRGSSTFYNNTDLRLKLFKWKNNVIPMDVGILGGYDIGKVYLDTESANTWKSSQTIGLWFDLLGVMVVQPYYSFNEEESAFSLQTGFSF